MKKSRDSVVCSGLWRMGVVVGFMVIALCNAYAAAPSDVDGVRTLKVRGRYLNVPVSHQQDRRALILQARGLEDVRMDVRLAEGEVDYWTFLDLSAWKGKKLTLSYEGSQEALDRVFVADTICGQQALYHEAFRPQYHFTPRRGWNNDPNGLVYHDGLYHLYFQHNPVEREWGNMTWGHSTSPDLIHWTERGDVLYPDHLGTMFSGSAVCDSANTSGFGSRRHPALVYAYTADCSERETQCIAYSTDGGMTLKKYAANPVIDSHDRWDSHDTRDPRLFWYHGTAYENEDENEDENKNKNEDKYKDENEKGHWVMVLYEKDGNSFYTSDNLKDWMFRSHLAGYFECPDMFELPVDGNPADTRWVMLGADNGYQIGRFDGETFTPDGGKQFFSSGTIYAAQTFSNVPDGRRIQMGWGRVSHPGMPFNGMMLLPTELTLKTTREGLRLCSQPVSEVKSLLHPLVEMNEPMCVNAVNALLAACKQLELHLRLTLQMTTSASPRLLLGNTNVLEYNVARSSLNDRTYNPQDATHRTLSVEVFRDRTTLEVFVDDGLFSYSIPLEADAEGKAFVLKGDDVMVSSLRIDAVESIWK